MLKIALCDDDSIQLDMLQEMFYDFNTVSAQMVDVSAFSSGRELLRSIAEKGRYDIYILDVMMPEIDGLNLAKKLREHDEIGKIIFLSAERSFVYKAFSVSASGYLLKPVNPEELFDLIGTLRAKIDKEKPSFVLVSAESGDRRVEVNDVLYIDTMDRAPIYHLADGTSIVGKAKRCRFQEMVAEFINGYPFVLSSVGVAVNLANVESVKKESNEILLKGGECLLCSRTMKDYFLVRLNEFWNT